MKPQITTSPPNHRTADHRLQRSCGMKPQITRGCVLPRARESFASKELRHEAADHGLI